MAFLNMVFTSFAFGEVPIAQLTGIPSRQSIIGDRYTFPAFIENSVISVSYFSFGLAAMEVSVYNILYSRCYFTFIRVVFLPHFRSLDPLAS
mgnify:CR=1 FL=1